MLKFLIGAICIASLFAPQDLKKMRAYYTTISEDEKSAISLKVLAKSNTGVPFNISRAYQAAAEMALAKYRNNPITRLNVFNSGKKMLESVVSADSTSLEIRYIRLAIQQNAPSFLGYNTSILKDRNYLINNLKYIRTTDPDLFSSIYAYLLTRATLTDKDKMRING